MRPPFRSPLRFRLKRWLTGCLYLGCAMPIAYTVLAAWTALDALGRALRRYV